MAHQYSRVGFKSSVEVNEVNLSLSYGGVDTGVKKLRVRPPMDTGVQEIESLCDSLPPSIQTTG